MKKFLLLLLMIYPFININAQYKGTRQNVVLVTTEDYVTNSPGNSIGTSKLIARYKDSTYIDLYYNNIRFVKYNSLKNDGVPTTILWVDSNGNVKKSTIPSWITSETDPQWNSDKTNYYTKTLSDARYLQSFTESDPIWSAVASLYRTKTQNDLLYQPIGSYLISETDPTVPAYSKSLTAFSVVKTSTDALYEPLFSKNTGFNLNLGTASSTVAEGNDGRINNGQTAFGWGNHSSVGYATASSSTNFTNKTGNISQWTNDSNYLVSIPGEINFYAGTSAPSGYLLCDGTAISRTTYSTLFGIISTTYGAGDGSTTFNLPDLRQRFPLTKAASGTGSTLGSTGGTIDHLHTVDPPNTTSGVPSATSGQLVGVINVASATHTHDINIAQFNSGTANPPYLVLNAIIKY